MFRIEPLNNDGTVDAEFIFSKNFEKYKIKVNDYLKLEGFETIAFDEITIQLLNRYWLIKWFN